MPQQDFFLPHQITWDKALIMKVQQSARRLLSEAAGSCTIPFYSKKEIERATNRFSEKLRLEKGHMEQYMLENSTTTNRLP
jgi:hypothetical protein